jgi:hypothetical protein
MPENNSCIGLLRMREVWLLSLLAQVLPSHLRPLCHLDATAIPDWE